MPAIVSLLLRYVPMALLGAWLAWRVLTAMHDAEVARLSALVATEQAAAADARAESLARSLAAAEAVRAQAEQALKKARAAVARVVADRASAEERLRAAQAADVTVADWLAQPVPEALR